MYILILEYSDVQSDFLMISLLLLCVFTQIKHLCVISKRTG